MKRNILYIFLVCMMVMIFFSFAALCNGCEAKEDEKIDTGQETAEKDTDITKATAEETEDQEETTESTAEENDEETTESTEDEETTEETTAQENEAPTISLSIILGPQYSDADDVCYYRVKATVTGKPKPAISFSKDDSLGAWGKDIAQINLESPAESYTLTATATNSEGSDNESITLTWGCDIPEPEIESEKIPVNSEEGGYIENTGTIRFPHDSMFAGDSNLNKLCRGFISFDISDFDDDIEIQEATLTMSPEQVWGDPTFMGSMWIEKVEYGPPPLVMSDYDIAATQIQSFTGPDIVCTHAKLKDELQDAIDNGKDRFQLRIRFTTPDSDDDNQWDGWDYLIDEVVLKIKYIED